MQEVRQEISEELYSEYRSMRYPERSEIIKEHVPIECYTDTGIMGIDYLLMGANFMLSIP